MEGEVFDVYETTFILEFIKCNREIKTRCGIIDLLTTEFQSSYISLTEFTEYIAVRIHTEFTKQELDYIEDACNGKISLNEVAINAYNKLKLEKLTKYCSRMISNSDKLAKTDLKEIDISDLITVITNQNNDKLMPDFKSITYNDKNKLRIGTEYPEKLLQMANDIISKLTPKEQDEIKAQKEMFTKINFEMHAAYMDPELLKWHFVETREKNSGQHNWGTKGGKKEIVFECSKCKSNIHYSSRLGGACVLKSVNILSENCTFSENINKWNQIASWCLKKEYIPAKPSPEFLNMISNRHMIEIRESTAKGFYTKNKDQYNKIPALAQEINQSEGKAKVDINSQQEVERVHFLTKLSKTYSESDGYSKTCLTYSINIPKSGSILIISTLSPNGKCFPLCWGWSTVENVEEWSLLLKFMYENDIIVNDFVVHNIDICEAVKSEYVGALVSLNKWSCPLELDENERSSLMALFCSTSIEEFNELAAKFQTENEDLARKLKHYDIQNLTFDPNVEKYHKEFAMIRFLAVLKGVGALYAQDIIFSIIKIQNQIGKEIAIQKYKDSVEHQPRYIYLPGCSFEGYISEDNLAVKEAHFCKSADIDIMAPSIQMKENTIWKFYYNLLIELKCQKARAWERVVPKKSPRRKKDE